MIVVIVPVPYLPYFYIEVVKLKGSITNFRTFVNRAVGPDSHGSRREKFERKNR